MSILREYIKQLSELISKIEVEISPFVGQNEKLKNSKARLASVKKRYKSINDFKPEIQAEVIALEESLKLEIEQLEDSIRCMEDLVSMGKYLMGKYSTSITPTKPKRSKEIDQFNGHAVVNESASKVLSTLKEKIKKIELNELGYFINLICDLSEDDKVSVVRNRLITRNDPRFHEKFFQNLNGSFLKEVLTYNHTLKTHFTLSDILMYYVNFTINEGVVTKQNKQ